MSRTKNTVINNRCYGRYNLDTKKFWCTHGAWEGEIEILDEEYCILFGAKVEYKFIDEIPEGWDYT